MGIPTSGDGPPEDAPASLPLVPWDGEIICMAFTETYHCDVCGNPRGDAEDWWLAMTEPASLIPTAPEQPMLKLTQWNILLSHAAKVRHLCGARCAQTLMDRWMRGE
jgi:hypothetical protein